MADPASGSTTSGSSSSSSTTGNNTWLTQLESFAGDVGSGLGLASGLRQGGVRGDIQAASSAAKLSGLGTSPLGTLSSDVNALYNIYGGMQRGGVSGYGASLVGAAQLGGQLAPFLAREGLVSAATSVGMEEAAGAANVLAIPLALYQFGKAWRSGSTGADALAGAEAGAAIGTDILPGIGTLVGAGLGAAAGALSSAFGGGRADPETTEWNQLAGKFNALSPSQQSQVVFSPQQAMTNLAGTMDAKNNSPGHSQPIEQVFGRMGENNLVQQMTTQINAKIASGAIAKNASPNDIYNQVVAPWLASKGASINMNEYTSHGQKEGPALVQSLKSIIGAWQSGGLTAKTPVGIEGQTISGLQAYGQGYNPQQQQQQQSMIQQIQSQLMESVNSLSTAMGVQARHG